MWKFMVHLSMAQNFTKKIHYKRTDHFLDLTMCPSVDHGKNYRSYLFTTGFYYFHYPKDKCF